MRITLEAETAKKSPIPFDPEARSRHFARKIVDAFEVEPPGRGMWHKDRRAGLYVGLVKVIERAAMGNVIAILESRCRNQAVLCVEGSCDYCKMREEMGLSAPSNATDAKAN